MPVIVFYTSTQACPPVLTLAMSLRAKGHQLRKLSQLPTPLPARTASLRLELAALQQDERTIRWTLSQYTDGRRPPDAYRQSGLLDDLAMTLERLHRVALMLQALATKPALA